MSETGALGRSLTHAANTLRHKTDGSAEVYVAVDDTVSINHVTDKCPSDYSLPMCLCVLVMCRVTATLSGSLHGHVYG